MTNPDTVIRSRSAHLVDVSNTVLANDVRLQVWDGYQFDNEGDPLRLADVRLTVDQAMDLMASLASTTTRGHRLAAEATLILAAARTTTTLPDIR